jgi:hypothetical protein
MYNMQIIQETRTVNGERCFEKFKFRALQKICLYFYDVECTVEMLECQNTRKKVSLALLVLRLVRCVSPALAFQHRHSGIGPSPVPLVTD